MSGKAKTSLPFPCPARYTHSGVVLSGGQGDVYICRDDSLEREVAIKTLKDVNDHVALVKEIEGRGRIRSKHVAEIYDCITSGSGKPIAIVMEFVPGESLADPNVHPSMMRDRLLLLYQMACGVADIHEAGVIHRDIKPLNMKVNASRVLKIFDLGIANLNADSASTVAAAGTMYFRAPELYSSMRPLPVTRAVDVYALGMIAWYLLAQAVPSPLLELPPQTSGAPMPSIQTAVPELAQLAGILDKALSVDPDQRPTSGELRDQISMHLTHDVRRGIFAMNQGPHELSKPGNISTISVHGRGVLRVAYSRGRFIIRDTQGYVYINNMPALSGFEMPNSCVITFGAPDAGAARVFVPFDVSQPEIVI